MSETADVRLVRRRFRNPHGVRWDWRLLDNSSLAHEPGEVIEIEMPEDQPCPFGMEEVLDEPAAPQAPAPAPAPAPEAAPAPAPEAVPDSPTPKAGRSGKSE